MCLRLKEEIKKLMMQEVTEDSISVLFSSISVASVVKYLTELRLYRGGGMRNIAILLFLVIFIIGCATTRVGIDNELQVQELKQRIEYLEKEVQEKDRTIANLENESQLAHAQNFSFGETEKEENVFAKLSDKQIQTALKNSGFYQGSIDGKIGAKTQKAIKAFQKAHGLKADGVPGKKTRGALSEYLK